jgi:hypothetical protein
LWPAPEPGRQRRLWWKSQPLVLWPALQKLPHHSSETLEASVNKKKLDIFVKNDFDF